MLVGEPSVPDTVQILRGLKERYASHHGVQIADRALVVAAELADRYITQRFLPGACCLCLWASGRWLGKRPGWVVGSAGGQGRPWGDLRHNWG